LQEDSGLGEERRRIAVEKEQLLRQRDQLNEQTKTEIERRDFMQLIRTTAENAS